MYLVEGFLIGIITSHFNNRSRIVSKDDEFCTKNEELCTKNEELCTKNKELCIKNAEFCRKCMRCYGS